MKKLTFIIYALMISAMVMAADVFKLVTDTAELKAGDQLILGTTITSGTSTSSYAAGAFGKNKFFSSVDATVTKDVISSDDAIIITLGGQKDAWTFTTSEGLVGTKEAKALVLDGKDATTTWTITFSEGNAVITSTETKYGSIQYNSNNPRFLNYASSQKPVQLYKMKKGGDTPTLVKSVAFVNTLDTLQVGGTKTLAYTITPDTATDQRVAFQSIDENALVVDEKTGEVLAGDSACTVKVVITALDSLNKGDKLTDTCHVTIIPIPMISVSSVKFDKATATVKMGKTLKLAYTIAPENATDKSVSFESLDENALVVDKTTGEVLAGDSACTVKVVITALDSLNKGDKLTDTCWVEVEAAPILKEVNTIANIKACYDAGVVKDNDSVKVTGYIARMFLKPSNFAKYGSVSIWLSSTKGGATEEFELYNCYGQDGDTLKYFGPDFKTTGSTEINVDTIRGKGGVSFVKGDSIVSFGKIKKYNDIYELLQGCYMIAGGRVPSDTTAVKAITFNNALDTIMVGKTRKLAYTIAPNDATDKRVSFQSLNEAALTVAKDGTITAVAENASVAVVITALDSLNKGDKLTDTCHITIIPVPVIVVSSVKFAEATASVNVGQTLKLAYNIAPKDAPDQRVSFQSLNEAALTVAEDGTITGVAENASVAVVITALDSLNKGDKLTDTCWVEVKAVSKYAGIFTSNISTSLKDSVVIGGIKYGAVKAGTSKASGSTTIEIPAYTSTLHFHAAAWKGETVKIQLASGNDTFGAFDLVADDGVSGTSSPYTLKNDPVENDYFALEIGNEESMEITVSAISGKRFVLFGINAEEQQGGDSVLVNSIAFTDDSASVEVGESLKLKYKIAPGNATDKRVSFTSLNEAALTVAEDGTITGVAANASVAVVITALDSLNKGDKLADTCFVTVVATVYNTCAEVNVAEKGDKIKLNAVTVVYVNGSNNYVKDASGSTLIYQYDAGLKAGDNLVGVKGDADIFNGLHQLKPTNKPAEWTITAGEAPAIPEAAAAPTAAEVNQVLIWKGVTGMSGEFKTDAKTTIKGVFGTDSIAFFNNFKIAQSFDKGKVYDITGAVAIYSKDDITTIQVYFISAEESTSAINEIKAIDPKKTIKVVENGKVVIYREGVKYNALGQIME